MAKTKNKDVIQSYIITTAKYDFSVYEKRILYRIVEMNQELLEGKTIDASFKVSEDLFGDREYIMPVSAFLKENDTTNYKEVKKAFLSLRNKVIEYEDERTWRPIGIVERPKIDKYDGFVTFTVDRLIYNALLDFSKGYKKYELVTAMQFESVYAMRFYELMSNQKDPIEFKIDKLKEIFGITDKYKLNADFFKRVINVAKKELDEKSPYSFEYETKKRGRAFYSILFFPKYIPKNRDSDLERKNLQKQVSLSWDLPKNIVDYLKHNFEFTTDGIKNNLDLFKDAHEQLDLIQFLASIKWKVRESSNPQGYVIGAIRKQIN